MAKKRPQGTLEYTAENIGAALGQLAGRLDAWKKHRAEIGAELQRVMQAAQRMMSDIGPSSEPTGPAPGGRTSATRKGGRPKGYAVSEETRAKLKAAWERRRAAAAKDQPKPADVRGAIRKTSGRKFSNRQRGKG